MPEPNYGQEANVTKRIKLREEQVSPLAHRALRADLAAQGVRVSDDADADEIGLAMADLKRKKARNGEGRMSGGSKEELDRLPEEVKGNLTALRDEKEREAAERRANS